MMIWKLGQYLWFPLRDLVLSPKMYLESICNVPGDSSEVLITGLVAISRDMTLGRTDVSIDRFLEHYLHNSIITSTYRMTSASFQEIVIRNF